MKETNPKLTPTKKKEANKYIKFIFENTGIKFTCKSIKDYIFIKTLYLLLVDYIEMENEFMLEMKNHYIKPNNWKKVEKYNYWGYDLHSIINSYLVRYYYGDLSNFAVSWEYYQDLVEGRLDEEFAMRYKKYEKEIDRSFRVLEKKIKKENEKMYHLFDNLGVVMIDVNTFAEFEELIEELEDDEDEEHEITLMWKSQRDNSVCEICAELDGKKFIRLRDVPQRHPNCRCELLVYVDGELFTKYK